MSRLAASFRFPAALAAALAVLAVIVGPPLAFALALAVVGAMALGVAGAIRGSGLWLVRQAAP